MILGIDEVGRGCWAGPLVVGAVVLGGTPIEGLTDSKLLSKKRRALMFDQIQESASGVGLGWVEAYEIDDIGLSAALRLATKRAVKSVHTPFHEIVIDGTVNFLSDTPLENHVTTIKKADLLVPSVSAASIVAKVSRDRYMAELDLKHPGYGFGSHVGYGTAAHRSAIEEFGVCNEHRLSIAPLNKYRGEHTNAVSTDAKQQDVILNTKKVGDAAEDLATAELVRMGHEVADRNWKTKYCEIDIVSRRDSIYYFIEVKHRKNPNSGDGLAAITNKKLNQMKFAAKMYAHRHRLEGFDMRLMVISTTGVSPVVERIVELP